MKNKIEFKKMLLICTGIIIFFYILFNFFYMWQYKIYTKNFNNKLQEIVSLIYEKYPKISANEIMEILNSSNNNNSTQIFSKYGIDIENESIILENGKEFKRIIIIDSVIIIVYGILLVGAFIIYDYNQSKKLKEITRYIEEINKKNYKLDIDDNTEDELSILKNELYKITIMLKEQAENSIQDKVKLKDTLSDISHQLKTPLSSILILLDNIIDNPNMDEKTKREFINDIKRETINISFLVQAILKLSRFDANAITFINKEESLNYILKEAIKNVEPLCDLRNVKIKLKGDIDEKIFCDSVWQIEAISNILKNAVEHSKDAETVSILCQNTKMYLEIKIIDNGEGISKKDLSHIFERFYKGEKSSKDSIGIGLSLSKSIIEKNNGIIFVDSEIGKGTTFTIKYFK